MLFRQLQPRLPRSCRASHASALLGQSSYGPCSALTCAGPGSAQSLTSLHRHTQVQLQAQQAAYRQQQEKQRLAVEAAQREAAASDRASSSCHGHGSCRRHKGLCSCASGCSCRTSTAGVEHAHEGSDICICFEIECSHGTPQLCMCCEGSDSRPALLWSTHSNRVDVNDDPLCRCAGSANGYGVSREAVSPNAFGSRL